LPPPPTHTHTLQRQLSSAGVGAVVQRDFAGAGYGALVPVIIAAPPLAELVDSGAGSSGGGSSSGGGGGGGEEAASAATLAALLTCIDLGADSAIEKPIALDQLAVRVRVLYARHCKAQAVMDQIRASQAVRSGFCDCPP
jgi:hypothetical protein